MLSYMPFGKYRGFAIAQIPSDYLEWVAGLPDLRPPLRDAVRAELRARAYAPPPARAAAAAGIDAGRLRDAVRSWFRRLISKHHPDRGGTHEAAVALVEAHEQLQEILNELESES